ncbi:SBBP repeat-containing protein, partial [bacterium AH-315-M05]|nr:SBBP repeat-containing protein [bacterium AH-315-M05]
TYITSSGGFSDIFVQKLDTSGNFLWVKKMGGTGTDWGRSIVDTSGNVYTTGTFEGTVDFNPGPGTEILISAGNTDIFVQKLDSSGNFLWVKQIGGTGSEGGRSAIDVSGNVYTTGSFEGTVDFDPGPGTANLDSSGNFVQKLDSSGNFLWAVQTGNVLLSSIKVDAFGNVYTSGIFGGTIDFDLGPGTAILTSLGGSDLFVQKLDASGNFLWVKQMGGNGSDCGRSITIDASGNLYTTGYFVISADFDPGPGTAILDSSEGLVFILKLDASGNYLWAIQMGGVGLGNYITVDSSGYIYTTGWFYNTADFDPGTGTANLTSAGEYDIFVHKLSPSPVGIIAHNFANELIIYPNPTHGDYSIDLGANYENATITITDILGKIIQTNTFNQNRLLNLKIEHTPGIYFLTIHSGNSQAILKIIKQ